MLYHIWYHIYPHPNGIFVICNFRKLPRPIQGLTISIEKSLLLHKWGYINWLLLYKWMVYTNLLEASKISGYLYLRPRSMKYQPKFGKNWPETKILHLLQETIEDNHWYHDASHQIRSSYIVTDQNNTCYLFIYINSMFGTIWFCVAILFILWFLFWHVDMFILHSIRFFF